MSYAIVQSKRAHQTTNVTSWTATFDSTTTSGNLLVAIAWAQDVGFDPMSGLPCTDAGTNTWVSAVEINHDAGFGFSRVGILYVQNCVGKASHVVTVTPTATGSGFLGIGDLEIFELSGIKTTGALDGTPTSNNGNSTTPTGGSQSPTAAGVHIAATGFGHFATITTTEDGGWTELFDPATSFGAHAVYRSAVASVAQNPGWTFDTAPQDHWSAVHAIFLDAPAGGGPDMIFTGSF